MGYVGCWDGYDSQAPLSRKIAFREEKIIFPPVHGVQARTLQNQNQFYFHVQLSRVESKPIESRIAHAVVPVAGFPVDQNSEAVDERDVPAHPQRFAPSTCSSSHKWTDTLIYGMVVTFDAFDPRHTTLDAAHCGGPANKTDLDWF